MKLRIQGIATQKVDAMKRDVDDHGNKPEVHVTEGLANPCRHCLQLINEGENKLVLSYMPFPAKQPYAETGPIFLHEKSCRHYDNDSFPDWFEFLEPAVIRGYDRRHWILYDTGHVVSGTDIEKTCRNILLNPEVDYVHIRSRFNCFQCKVTRDH